MTMEYIKKYIKETDETLKGIQDEAKSVIQSSRKIKQVVPEDLKKGQKPLKKIVMTSKDF